jgi:hypothetical protein
MEDLDRAFICGVYDRCAGNLDLVVDGEEVGHALGLDETETAEVVARLMRTGFVRDVAAHIRIKITTRGIAEATREPAPSVPTPLPASEVSWSPASPGGLD